jgi:hypothetical protein
VINFRYHVVSLTAVFLALAIGLVVGTTALNGPVADSLKNQISALNKDNSNKRDQINEYRDQINRNQDFAAELAPTLLAGKLTGRKLLVVALPGSNSDNVDGVVGMLKIAGATITARITVQDKFFDPNVSYELLDLASESSQPTIQTEGLPHNSDGVETASAQLALALLQHSGIPASADDVTAVLTAYGKQSYISVDEKDGKAVGGAEATVIISGTPPIDKDAAKKSQSAVTMAHQFNRNDKPLVVAGDGVGAGNLISAVRGDPTLVKQISTVDNASTVEGQVAAGMAMAECLVQGKVGQYGLSAGATSMVPKGAV